MNDEKAEKIIQLLQEMRDLQKQSMENYQVALRNQEESLRVQKAASDKVRKFIFPVLLIVIILALFAVLLVVRLLLRYR